MQWCRHEKVKRTPNLCPHPEKSVAQEAGWSQTSSACKSKYPWAKSRTHIKHPIVLCDSWVLKALYCLHNSRFNHSFHGCLMEQIYFALNQFCPHRLCNSFHLTHSVYVTVTQNIFLCFKTVCFHITWIILIVCWALNTAKTWLTLAVFGLNCVNIVQKPRTMAGFEAVMRHSSALGKALVASC